MKSGGSRQPTVNKKSSQRPSSSSRAGGGEARTAPKREAGGVKRKEAPAGHAESRATKSKGEDGGSRPAGKAAASKKAFGISDDTVVVEMDKHGHYYGEKEFPYNDKFMAKARDRYDKHIQERTDCSEFVLKFRDNYIDFGNGDVSD